MDQNTEGSRASIIAEIGDSDFELLDAIKAVEDGHRFRDFVLLSLSDHVAPSKTDPLIGGLYMTGETIGGFADNTFDLRLSRLDNNDVHVAEFYDDWLDGSVTRQFEHHPALQFNEDLTRDAIRSLLAQVGLGQKGMFLGGVELRAEVLAFGQKRLYSTLVVPYDFRMASRTLMEDSIHRVRTKKREDIPDEYKDFGSINDPMFAAKGLALSAVHHLLSHRNAAK